MSLLAAIARTIRAKLPLIQKTPFFYVFFVLTISLRSVVQIENPVPRDTPQAQRVR